MREEELEFLQNMPSPLFKTKPACYARRSIRTLKMNMTITQRSPKIMRCSMRSTSLLALSPGLSPPIVVTISTQDCAADDGLQSSRYNTASGSEQNYQQQIKLVCSTTMNGSFRRLGTQAALLCSAEIWKPRTGCRRSSNQLMVGREVTKHNKRGGKGKWCL